MSSRKKKLFIVAFVSALLAVFAGVYFVSKPQAGLVPNLPDVKINREKMDFAVRRLKQRAASVTLNQFHQELQEAFKALNLAEATGATPQRVIELRQIFLEKTEIAQTAKKERYLLFGDYLAVEFEKSLFAVLEQIRSQGIERVTRANSADYKNLIALSGSFLANSLKNGLILPNGKLNVEKYVPQILFRKRWRMLGEIPFRLNFMRIESLVDAAYLLKFGQPEDVERRLKAIHRIYKQDSQFDAQVARALVLYEGKESKRALLIMEKVKKNRPDDFVVNEFHLFLSNRVEQ